VIVERLLRIALLGSTWVLWLLLALSVVSFAAMADRWIFFRRHRDDGESLRLELSSALLDDDLEQAKIVLEKSPSIEARVLRRALDWRRGGRDAVSDVVESELARERKELERGLTLLGTLGNNTPFVGLFGTVLGVIEAFHHLGDGAAKAGNMGNVMSGIAEALIATGVGIFVAIPAVVAYNIAAKRIGEIEDATKSLSKLITAWLATQEPKAETHYLQAAE
jgi:biopolymer transport protein ExbB/biopolymer transport protein TolQ